MTALKAEFNGRPFVAGSLTGIRAFKVDADGHLTGVVHEQVWTPDVNEASCEIGDLARSIQRNIESLARAMGAPPTERRPHHVAGLGCQCGFYAYFKGQNSYMGSGQIAGIVEGYGVCTVGTRGFRAERARLVALVAPRRDRLPRVRAAWWRWLRLVRAVVRPPIHKVAHEARWLLSLRPRGLRRAQAVNWLERNCWRVTDVIQVVLGFAITAVAIWALSGLPELLVWLAGISIANATPDRQKPSGLPAVGPAEFAVVRRNYPDVPVYRSRRAAVRAHPLTPPDRKRAS